MATVARATTRRQVVKRFVSDAVRWIGRSLNPFKAFKNWLLNRDPLEEGKSRLVDIDEIFETKNPWQTELYYDIYRFFRWNWIFHPTEWYYNTKYFIQRGRRGWSNRDTWSLDYYLDSWMPEALEHLKKNKHGFPCSVYTKEEMELTTCYQEEGSEEYKAAQTASDEASARWDVILDKIIEGFKASRRMNDGLYEKDLGEYPVKRPEGMDKASWRQLKDNHMAAINLLMERDEKLRVEGMTLFVTHYQSLWD